MSEKIDLSGEIVRDTFLGQLLLGAMTEAQGSKAIEHFKLDQPDKMVEFDLRVNGVPLSVEEFVKIWDRSREYFVKKEVKAMMSEKLDDKFVRVTDKMRDIENAMKELIRQEFPGFDADEF